MNNYQIYDYLRMMPALISSKDWDKLEADFQQICDALASAKGGRLIGLIDLTDYTAKLRKRLIKAHQAAIISKVQAIYFEYNLDDNWNSHFFLCPQYRDEEKANDDWACDFVQSFRGPACSVLAQFYSAGFDRTEFDRGITLLLIARTMAAFGRATGSLDTDLVKICAGFHDQDPVFRFG